MKLLSYAVPVLILLLSFFYNTNPFIVKEEARQVYRYLDTVRFHWNDSLAREAEAKALDMARRQQNRQPFIDRNYFEYFTVGAVSGREAMQNLMTDFPAFTSPVNIGIGYVKCDIGKHRSYTCILITTQQ
jgi:hypothetical protein